MRLQVIDPNAKFACSGCGHCCEQPWRTLIEADKLEAIDATDWAAEFPALGGRELFRAVRDGDKTVYELSKLRGNRCIFLDEDNRCVIHKKLGYDAKPQMCKQFPFFPARAWEADYVSVNYGCKAVQKQHGPPLDQQAEAIRATVELTDKPTNATALVALTPTVSVPQDAARALLDFLGGIVDCDGDSSINVRLARALASAERAAATSPDDLLNAARDGSLQLDAIPDAYLPLPSAAQAPMASRFLFAATLFPDTLPIDSTADLSLLRRLTLVPKLMSLTQLRGAYPSRLLAANVRIDEFFGGPAEAVLAPEATRLLGRYLRSRLWQQFPAGTRLPVLSALHQHILDINAVIFFSLALQRADAQRSRSRELDLATVERALMLVEFHLSNQPRLYQQLLKKWLRTSLATPALAWGSLRMLRCAPTHADSRPTADARMHGSAR